LGIVAYEVIKGEHPFAGANQAVISYQIITQDIALPDTADRYRVLLRGLLSRNPKERWGYEQVRAWLEGKIESRKEDTPQKWLKYALSDWEREGFTAESARLWAELGLSPSDALSFDETGFSVEEARRWVEAGFKSGDGERCKRWQDAGFKPEEVRVYESFDLNIQHAKRLKAWKITALHLSPYRGQTKLTDSLKHLLSDLDSLKANPQSPPEWVSELLNDSELFSVLSDELKQKYRYFHEPTHSDLLRALGGELASAMVEQLDPDLLIEAAQQEMSAAELLTAQVYGIPLKDYLKYRPHGLSQRQARELFQAGVKPEDYVKGVEQGLTYPEILVCRGEVYLSEYLHFRKYGLTLEQAGELLQAGVKPEDYVKGVEQGLTYPEVLEISRRGVNLSEYLHLRKYGITLRESTFVAQGLQQIAIEGPLSVSSPLIIEKSSLTLKNLSLKTLRVSDSQVSLEGCSFPEEKYLSSPRLEIVSSDVALEEVRIERVIGMFTICVGIRVRDSRLTLREVSLTGLREVGIRLEGQTAVEGDQLSIRQCGRGMEVRPGAKVQLTRPTLIANRTGIVVEGAALVLKGPGKLTYHQGPAILVEKNGSLSAEELTFEENQKDRSTGQIHLVGASKVSLQKITVQNSEAIGLYAENCPEVLIINSTFVSNLYNAIRLVKSRLIVSEVKILENGGVVGGRYFWQVALYDQAHLKIEKSSIEHGKYGGIWAKSSEVEIAKCQIHSHNVNGVLVEGGSGCIIGSSQLENNGLGSSEENHYPQLFVKEVEKVALSDLRVIGGKGEGVYLESCKNASLSGKSIIRGNQRTGLWAWRAQLTVEQAEFQDNGKQSTPFLYYHSNQRKQIPYCYQIFAGEASYVQLKEVQIYEGQHSGGIWVGHQGTVKLEGGSIHGHWREAIAVQDSGSKIVVIGTRIFGNAQEAGAQVIVKDSGTAEMGDACIQDSPHGGALVEDGGTLILKRCQVHNNKAYNLKREGTGRVEFIDMPPVEDSSES
jgi:hypothetical protein